MQLAKEKRKLKKVRGMDTLKNRWDGVCDTSPVGIGFRYPPFSLLNMELNKEGSDTKKHKKARGGQRWKKPAPNFQQLFFLLKSWTCLILHDRALPMPLESPGHPP